MRQLKAALLAGLMLSGCGVAANAPYAALPVRPVQTANGLTARSGVGLSADKTLMPPLEVFKALETDAKTWLTEFKKANELQYAIVSPVLHTMRLKMGPSKVGYLVTTTGNCKWNPTKNGGASGAFLQLRAYAPNGESLGYGSSFLAINVSGTKVDRQPGKAAVKQNGPLTFKFLEQAPETIAKALTGVYPEQTDKLAAVFRTRQVAPIKPTPWIMELSYEGQVIGYLDEQVTVALNQGKPGFNGIEVVNLLDSDATEVAAYGFGIDPVNPLNYKQFML